MQQKTLRLLWGYSKPYAKLRWFALFNAAFTSAIAGFIGPFILSGIFTQLQSGTITLDSSWPIIIGYTLSEIYGEIIGWRLNLYAMWKMEGAAQRDIYHDIFSKLSNESLSFHANRFGGSLVSQANKLNGAFEKFWDTMVFQLTPVITGIVVATVILWQFFWQYALFLFVLSVLFAFVVFFTSRFMAKLNTTEAQASTKMTGRIADMLTNVITVKSYAREHDELQSAKTYSLGWYNATLATMRGFLKVSSAYASIMTMLTTGALIFAIIASEHHLISAAVVYLSISYTLTVARLLWETNNIMRNYNRIMGDAYDMVEILNTPMQLTDRSTKKLSVTHGTIAFEDMSFAHDDGKGVKIFDNFSLTIAPGERVGLVGHSGSGKSSLVRLLLRFSDIDSGKIMIDSQDISRRSQASVRESIAYVPQEPMLFHRSLRENIAYGKPDASDDEIITAARQANAWDFITTLPDGLDTLVGERGIKLSGGQRQRIAIARAILKDAPILVLDEATSALDSESEKLIQDALTKLMNGHTSIVIAHRLSTIAKLDRIIVLDNGRIAESGTHRELIARDGIYAKLWSHQSGGFIEE